MLKYPNIDPIAIYIGPHKDLNIFGLFTFHLPLHIRWYSISYIVGIMAGWWYAGKMNTRAQYINKPQFDAILTWIVAGIILGGRLGYVIFYNLGQYLSDPLQILFLWDGGMSFHGGMIGTVLGIYIFCRKNNIQFFRVMDVAACVSPIGLGLGRLANFVNGELYGRVTNSPLGMVFPNGGPLPRHPSQLYEAGMEGFLFLAILSILFWRYNKWRYPGFLSGTFLICYSVFRSFAECFREPDVQLGYILPNITMGQILCIPMLLLGIFLIIWSSRRPIEEQVI